FPARWFPSAFDLEVCEPPHMVNLDAVSRPAHLAGVCGQPLDQLRTTLPGDRVSRPVRDRPEGVRDQPHSSESGDKRLLAFTRLFRLDAPHVGSAIVYRGSVEPRDRISWFGRAATSSARTFCASPPGS